MLMKSIVVILFGFLVNLLNNLRLLKKPKQIMRKKKNLPLVSILVPARNEEERIEKCLCSLINQRYPRVEIIVFDDNSTDGTGQIVTKLARKHKHVHLVRGGMLPEGWTGKNFACHQLSLRARGEWLLFTDADTIHDPDSISSVLNLAKRENADLVSLLPHITCGSWAEKIFMPIIHFVFMALLPLGLINRPNDRRISVALGPFMLFNRRFYNRVGGHKAIKSEIVDDLCLAKVVKAHSGKIAFVDGSDLMTVRFYKNWREIWHGFSKNSFGAFEYSVPLLGGCIVSAYFLFLHPYLVLLNGLYDGVLFEVAFLQVSLITFIRLILAHRFKTSYISAVLHPVAVIMGLLIVMNSFWLWFSKGSVAWKERSYATIHANSDR